VSFGKRSLSRTIIRSNAAPASANECRVIGIDLAVLPDQDLSALRMPGMGGILVVTTTICSRSTSAGARSSDE